MEVEGHLKKASQLGTMETDKHCLNLFDHLVFKTKHKKKLIYQFYASLVKAVPCIM